MNGDMQQQRIGRAVFLLVALILAYILSFIDRQVLALLVAPIKADLGINDFQIGLLQGLAFSLCFCIAGLPVGWLVDGFNRKYLVAAGIFVWSIATALCGLSSSFMQLFAARMLVGIGEAVITPAAYSMLADAFPPRLIVRAMTTFSMAGVLGVGTAFLAGGSAIATISTMDALPFGLRPWQFAFILVGLPGVLVALFFLLVHEPQRGPTAGEDVQPIATQLRYLWSRRREYLPYYLCSMLLATIAYNGFVWMPTHLIRAFGLTAPEAGYILGVIYLCASVLGTIAATMTTERFQRQNLAHAPMRTVLIIALCTMALGLTPLVGSLWITVMLFAPLAFLMSGYYGNIVAALQMITPPRLRGINSAFFILVTNLGSLGIGTAVIGAMSHGIFRGQPGGIGVSMAVVNCLCATLAAVIVWRKILRGDTPIRD